MIKPGLQRITKLLAQTPLTWRAIHVAGTNGKGSTCAYINSILRKYNKMEMFKLTGHEKLSYGRFTSPHLVDRWDGIRINDEVISKRDFLEIESHFKDYDKTNDIGASEFEILTATAFEAFNRAKVDIAVVEVGMGGRDDATNIIGQQEPGGPARPKPLVTVITNIALDHQSFLGNTVQEIAAHKAGIMKPGVPVTFATEDEGSTTSCTSVLAEHAHECDAPILWDWAFMLDSIKNDDFKEHLEWCIEGYDLGGGHHATHLENVELACNATFSALEQLGRLVRPRKGSDKGNPMRVAEFVATMDKVHLYTVFPGRCDFIEIEVPSTQDRASSQQTVLLDGAHNAAAASMLKRLAEADRRDERPIIWVVGHSQGRPVGEFLKHLLQPGDSVIATEFGPVDGMPWVKPMAADEIVEQARRLLGAQGQVQHACERGAHEALLQAFELAQSGQLIVVTGSLYLVGDVHRLLRDGILRRVNRLSPPVDLSDVIRQLGGDETFIFEEEEEFVEPYSQG